MNSNIEQMMLDATVDMPQGYYVPYQYWERFAEMLIKECADRISNDVRMSMITAENVAHDLRMHFGIEK